MVFSGSGPVVRHVFIELVVFFRLHFRRRPFPDRLHRVQRRVLAFLLLQDDGPGDEVRMLLHDAGEAPLRRCSLRCRRPGPLPEDRACDAGAVRRLLFSLADGIRSVAIRLPLRSDGRPGAPRHQANLIGHHEGRVEADAELPDQAGRVRRRTLLFKRAPQFARARLPRWCRYSRSLRRESCRCRCR